MRIVLVIVCLLDLDRGEIDVSLETTYNHVSTFIYESSRHGSLSEIITLLRPHAALSKPITARGRWAVRYQAHDAPGFTLILTGQAWVTFEGSAPLRLAEGDFLLMPTTPAFSLSSEPELAGPLLEPSKEAVRHGEQDGEPDFAALGGSFLLSRPTPLFCSPCCPT
jgi:hypothetical protein